MSGLSQSPMHESWTRDLPFTSPSHNRYANELHGAYEMTYIVSGGALNSTHSLAVRLCPTCPKLI